MSGSLKEKKLYFIVNPQSGGGSTAAFWQAALQMLNDRGYEYFWEYTQAGNVGAQVRRAVLERGAEAVIAMGGDGTLYDVLNGIVENDRLINDDLIFAAYPTGSARDFGRTVFPEGRPDLLTFLEQAKVAPIDIGRCAFEGGEVRYFINSFDVGAGADTCAEVNRDEGRIKRFWKNGRLAFKLTALRILMTFKYTDTTVELDNEIFRGSNIILGCGNGRYIGGGMNIFSLAEIDDGLLDVILIPRMSRMKIIRVFSRVYNGTVRLLPGVVYRQTTQVRITAAKALITELDGEIPGTTPVEIKVLPGMLPFMRA